MNGQTDRQMDGRHAPYHSTTLRVYKNRKTKNIGVYSPVHALTEEKWKLYNYMHLILCPSPCIRTEKIG